MSLKNFKETETNKVEMDIVISKETFENAVNAVFKRNAKSISIPGFRKGKATRGLVEKFYGSQVFYEDAINDLLPSEINAAVKETPYKIAGMPEVTDVDFEAEDGINAKVTFIRVPDVKLGEYKGLKVDKVVVKTEDSEVDAELERTRERYSRTISVTDRAAKDGDIADINYEGFCDGKAFEGGKAENHKLKLGSGSFIPGFEDQIVGKNVGDEFDVNVTFPKEYHAAELAGKDATFKCKLNGLEFEELPTLDDEFAKDNGFDTLDEYKADVKADLEKRKTEQREGEVRADLMHKAIENMTVEVPEVMVKEKAEEIIRNYARNFGVTDSSIPMDKLCEMLGLNEEAMKTSIMPAAEAQVKNDLLLEAIVAAEGFAPTEEETEEYIAKTAEKLGAKAEELKQYFGVDFIAEEQKKEMASNIIFDTAIITEAAPEEKAEEKAEETEKEAE